MQQPRRVSRVHDEHYRFLREELIRARLEAGITQSELASRIDRSKSHLCCIERGHRRLDMLEFYLLSKGIGVRPVDLFSRIADRLEREQCGSDR